MQYMDGIVILLDGKIIQPRSPAVNKPNLKGHKIYYYRVY